MAAHSFPANPPVSYKCKVIKERLWIFYKGSSSEQAAAIRTIYLANRMHWSSHPGRRLPDTGCGQKAGQRWLSTLDVKHYVGIPRLFKGQLMQNCCWKGRHILRSYCFPQTFSVTDLQLHNSQPQVFSQFTVAIATCICWSVLVQV